MPFNRTRADKLLAREGIDAVVATSRENVEYITGHQNQTHMLMKASLIFAVYSPETQPAASAIIPTLEVETFMASRSCETTDQQPASILSTGSHERPEPPSSGQNL